MNNQPATLLTFKRKFSKTTISAKELNDAMSYRVTHGTTTKIELKPIYWPMMLNLKTPKKSMHL